MIFGKIENYVIKEFCKMFFYITFGTTLLVFFIDFLEFYGKIDKFQIKMFDAIKIVLFRTPSLIEITLYFIILLSSSFALTKLSITSELVAINSNKKSLVDLIIAKSIFVFVFGLLYINYINPFITKLSEISIDLENKYTKEDTRNYLTTKNGIWFKQNNIENDIVIGEIIFKAEKLYLDNLEFNNVNILFVGNNSTFYKTINSKYMKYENNNFILKDNEVLKKNSEIEYINEIILPTKLTEKFLKQYMQNQYEDINKISFSDLGKLIKEFKASNLDINRFLIKQYTMILIPFTYVVMIMISYVFISINSRKQDYIINIFKTVMCSFFIFSVQNILARLGSAGILNVYLSTLLPFFAILFITTILITKKIKLCNF